MMQEMRLVAMNGVKYLAMFRVYPKGTEKIDLLIN